MMMTRLLIFVVLAFSLPHNIHADDGALAKKDVLKERQKLKKVLEEIEETKEDIDEAKLKEKRLFKELSQIEKILDKRTKAASRVAADLEKLNGRILKEAEKNKHLKKEIKKNELLLKDRMVALYKLGKAGPMKAVFSSDSYIDLLKRHRFMQLIIKKDISTISDYRNDLIVLDASLKSLEQARREKEELRKELAAKKKAAQREQANKKGFLASISRSKALQMKALKELEESSAEIGKMISKLETSLSPEREGALTGRFSSLRGRLDFPADGEITAFFGKTKDPTFNTTIFRKGIEIAAAKGSEIRAIFSGKVLYADWFRGYGKIIIIDHGEGYYSLSAHASEILKKVGDEVNVGNVVALAGDTGSLKGPYLYFEIRHKGKPVDPLKWLMVPAKETN